jgi:hypothetical protein
VKHKELNAVSMLVVADQYSTLQQNSNLLKCFHKQQMQRMHATCGA